MEGRFPPNPTGSLDPAAILQQDGIRKQGGYGWGREEESGREEWSGSHPPSSQGKNGWA